MFKAFFARFRKPAWQTLPGAPPIGTRVCRLADLEEDRPIYVEIGSEGGFLCFVVLRNSSLHAFRANCPHRNRPMGTANLPALYRDGKIGCHHHGARFDVETGRCVSGPCRGEDLCAVEVHEEQDWVVIGPGR